MWIQHRVGKLGAETRNKRGGMRGPGTWGGGGEGNLPSLGTKRGNVGFNASNVNPDFLIIFVNNFNNPSIKSARNSIGALPVGWQFAVKTQKIANIDPN